MWVIIAAPSSLPADLPRKQHHLQLRESHAPLPAPTFLLTAGSAGNGESPLALPTPDIHTLEITWPPSTPPSTAKPQVNGSSTSALLEKLAAVLPAGHKFGIHHLSTPPARTDPLFSAPPGEQPDKTYWENHFLAVSIDVPHGAAPSRRASSAGGESKQAQKQRVFVLALEIFIFTTAYSTTLFVSKADSTGYLQLLQLPKGAPSPIREISSTFVTHLLEHRRREGIQLVVSLFARSQNQYLFPLSVENKGKHVLDDRGLVKWWCRVLDPLLLQPKSNEHWESVKGYLIVPGLERNEVRFFLPRGPAAHEHWILGHPMERISHYTKEFDWVPPAA